MCPHTERAAQDSPWPAEGTTSLPLWDAKEMPSEGRARPPWGRAAPAQLHGGYVLGAAEVQLAQETVLNVVQHVAVHGVGGALPLQLEHDHAAIMAWAGARGQELTRTGQGRGRAPGAGGGSYLLRRG